jgi:two-component system nitrate/nitrite response regulator NarL
MLLHDDLRYLPSSPNFTIAGAGHLLPARVLIVDDHEATRRGVRSIFADGRWEVCGEAENGYDAIEKVRELKPGLVILDISMPVMNGIQAACEIRALAPSTKILIFSMHESTHLEEVLRDAGVDAFVSKTATMGQLLETAETLLDPKLQHR